MTFADAGIAFAVMAYLVVVALLVGSFINLAADRLPRGESLIRPRSHCRSCGRVLNFVDLIPVGGYLIRRGRCATCGVSIGAASPAVEALCGLSMLVSLTVLGLVKGAVVGAAAVSLVGLASLARSLARKRSGLGAKVGGVERPAAGIALGDEPRPQ
jgi:prepilin signal peptidase PulO-like enzyme (type II secretory pathway)